jgi:hypothetical protein
MSVNALAKKSLRPRIVPRIATGELHVRVGLARAWEDRPGRCYLMINGVFW